MAKSNNAGHVMKSMKTIRFSHSYFIETIKYMPEVPNLSSAEQSSLLENSDAFPGDVYPEPQNISHLSILFINALGSLILRLWLSTVTISMLMYVIRRIPIHHLKHQSGRYISDQDIGIFIDKNEWSATPSLFGRIFDKPITGNLISNRPNNVYKPRRMRKI